MGMTGGGGSVSGKPQNNFPAPQYGLPSPQGGGQRGYGLGRNAQNMMNQRMQISGPGGAPMPPGARGIMPMPAQLPAQLQGAQDQQAAAAQLPAQMPGMPPKMGMGGNQWQDPRALSPLGKGNMPPGMRQKPGQPPPTAQQLPAAAAPAAPAGPDMSWQGGN